MEPLPSPEKRLAHGKLSLSLQFGRAATLFVPSCTQHMYVLDEWYLCAINVMGASISLPTLQLFYYYLFVMFTAGAGTSLLLVSLIFYFLFHLHLASHTSTQEAHSF